MKEEQQTARENANKRYKVAEGLNFFFFFSVKVFQMHWKNWLIESKGRKEISSPVWFEVQTNNTIDVDHVYFVRIFRNLK